MSKIIESFDTCTNIKLASGNQATIPQKMASLLVKTKDHFFFCGISSQTDEKIGPIVYTTRFDNNFCNPTSFVSGKGLTEEGMLKSLGWTLEKKGTELVAKNAEVIQIVSHFRFGCKTPSFAIKLDDQFNFPAQTKGMTKPFVSCDVVLVGTEFEGAKKAALFDNPLSEEQTGALLRNTIWNGKAEHGVYNVDSSTAIRKGKFAYYLATVYPNASKTVNSRS
jgi:hypothetical protein